MNNNAKECSRVAGEIRGGFSLWRNMVMELLISSEQELSYGSTESRKLQTKVASAEVEQQMHKEAKELAKEDIERLSKRLEKAERRLGGLCRLRIVKVGG